MLATAGLVAGAGYWGDLWMTILFGIAILVPLIALLLYKNRSRQTSLLIAQFLLLAGCAGFTIYGVWFTHAMWAYAPVLIFAAFVTNWLALRGVLKDDMLVKTSNRLR